ncbi:MAG: beta-lactamase family protein [Candidatus Eremiobacteraeota bacterium]|nr:beta-lactamase family protein [Candidatus Eremiobacteraeota bacterium]
MQRRDFLALSVAGASTLPVPSNVARAAGPPSAQATTLDAFTEFVAAFMKKWQIPAGTAAVAKDGRLVYARGFGYADIAKTQPTNSHHRFRIASSSKPVTAVAILRLVQDGKLQLDEPAFARLSHLAAPPGKHEDPRLRTITVRHLLEHSGGFDSTKTDPQFDALRVAADAVGRPRPATPSDLIRYMMGQPLAFTPGTKYIYSNFGYNVLGRIIEQVSGVGYERHVKEQVLRPIGVHEMEVGRTKPTERLPREVQYWDDPLTPSYYSVYEDDSLPRTYSYGGFSMEAIDAHGGWVARSVDLTRFLDAVGGAEGHQLLKAETVKRMLDRPQLAQYKTAKHYYALGWDVTSGELVMSHNGALTWGTATSIARLPNGITYALCFNRLGYDLVNFVSTLVRESARILSAVASWPEHNLYPSFGLEVSRQQNR